MKLQFYHGDPNRKMTGAGGFTIAAFLPSKQELVRRLDEFITVRNLVEINLELGYALLHPNDKYNKKIGRLLATKNMDFHTFTVENIFVRSFHKTEEHLDHRYVTLYSKTVPFYITLKYFKRSDVVWLVDAERYL